MTAFAEIKSSKLKICIWRIKRDTLPTIVNILTFYVIICSWLEYNLHRINVLYKMRVMGYQFKAFVPVQRHIQNGIPFSIHSRWDLTSYLLSSLQETICLDNALEMDEKVTFPSPYSSIHVFSLADKKVSN